MAKPWMNTTGRGENSEICAKRNKTNVILVGWHPGTEEDRYLHQYSYDEAADSFKRFSVLVFFLENKFQ